MKDRTNSMNRGFSAGAGSEKGFEKLPDSEIASTRDRKNRQLRWANLDDNEAMQCFENTYDMDQDMDGGFLPRNNYEDRN